MTEPSVLRSRLISPLHGYGAFCPERVATSLAILFASIAGYLLACYALQERVVDDAYISFRFARNLASGNGITWNPGSLPVEGSTSMLQVVLLSTVHWAGGNIEIGQRWIAFASVLGTVLLIVAIAHRHLGRAVHPWVAIVIGLYLSDE